MAWWRERLEALDAGDAPAEPRLSAVQAELVPRGVSGEELSRLEDGWLPLLEPFPWGEAVADGLKLRGRILFGIGARVLGGNAGDAEAAGALWSLVDGARHCSDLHSRMVLLEQARAGIPELPKARPPKARRRLTGLAAMAAHDALRGPQPELPYFGAKRGMAALLHYMLGTFPHA